MRADNDKGSERVGIGKRIRQARESMKMTREELADRVDITPRFLADIEAGIKGMSMNTLCGISKELGVSLDHIVNGECRETPVKNSQIRDIREAMDMLLRGLDERGFHFLEDVYSYGPEADGDGEDSEEESDEEERYEEKKSRT